MYTRLSFLTPILLVLFLLFVPGSIHTQVQNSTSTSTQRRYTHHLDVQLSMPMLYPILQDNTAPDDIDLFRDNAAPLGIRYSWRRFSIGFTTDISGTKTGTPDLESLTATSDAFTS